MDAAERSIQSLSSTAQNTHSMKPYLTLPLALIFCTSCSEKQDSTTSQNESKGKTSQTAPSRTQSARTFHQQSRLNNLMERSSEPNLEFDYVQQVADLLDDLDRPLTEEEAAQVGQMLKNVEEQSPRLAESIVRKVDLSSDHYPETLKHSMLTCIRPPVEQFRLSLSSLQSQDYLDDILEKSLTRVEAEDIPLIVERLYDESNRGPEFNSSVLRTLFKSRGIAIDDLNHAASSLMELQPELVPDALRGFYKRLDKLVEDQKMEPAEAELIKSIMQ
ncbi:hypothetical protein SAMN02745181_1370 [Rubritalea squalenifaciens DSM 18772]|uniref:Uncharacterized protein n=2 Tax=Rubritalea squalenifaciens TaxID=407226 RepID=A0A1M6H5U2_9BACT|nr:hypothetical protein SAMN02745181_1370 [Rubritalea squalenifaciens DSM 18772]